MHRNDRLTDDEFRAVCRHLDGLVREFEALPFPEVRDHVFELLQAVDALHREGLGRLVGYLREHEQGHWVDQAVEDPAVRTLLGLYDLAPLDAPGGTDASDARDMANVSFIPLGQIGFARPVRRPVFRELTRLDAVPPGTMVSVDVDGAPVLLTNVGGEIHAVSNTCPGSVAPLSLGSFSSPIVTCPWHNEAFDVRTGKRADGGPGPGLDVFPVSVQDGAILMAVGTAPAPSAAGRVQ